MFPSQRGVYRAALTEYRFRLMEEGCVEDVAPCGKRISGDTLGKMLIRCIDGIDEKPQTINCGTEFARGKVALCNNCYADFLQNTISGEEIELDRVGIFPEESESSADALSETEATENIESEIRQQNKMPKIHRVLSWIYQNPCHTGAFIGLGIGLILTGVGVYNDITTQSSNSEIVPTAAQMPPPPSI